MAIRYVIPEHGNDGAFMRVAAIAIRDYRRFAPRSEKNV